MSQKKELEHADRKSAYGLSCQASRMTNFDMCLSSAAIQTIVINTIQEDLEFVFWVEGYKCSRILA
jgi:hypothetical protein